MTGADNTLSRDERFEAREPVASVEAGSHARVMGWCSTLRDLGGVKFAVLRDSSGELQITFRQDGISAELEQTFEDLTTESVVYAAGEVETEHRAPGGLELFPETVTILNEATNPLPVDVSGDTEANVSTRFDNRMLDVRRPEKRAIFEVRSAIVGAIQEVLRANGATQVSTPTITPCENVSNTSEFEVEYFDHPARLRQSPLQYLRIATGMGIEKVFEVSPIYSAEKHNSKKHLNEATSISFEQAFASLRETYELAEEAIVTAYERVHRDCTPQLENLEHAVTVPTTPFERVTYQDCLDIANENADADLSWGDNPWAVAGRELGEEIGTFYIVTEWPVELRPSYVRRTENDDSVAAAFALFHPNTNLSSGSQRNHTYDRRRQTLVESDVSIEAADPYLEPFDYGVPPHAGWTIGIERLTMAMLDLENIREASLFPRTRNRMRP